MFARAYDLAKSFTIPVTVSMRFYDGSVECGVGAAIVVNDEGWIITAAHNAEPVRVHLQHQSEIADYERKVAQITGGQGNATGKKKRIRSLGTGGRKWIMNYSYWWGVDGVQVAQFEVLNGADLAVGKLEPFDPSAWGISGYPVFKPQPETEAGLSLCKLGFPFHSIAATYDTARDVFEFPPNALPIPRFPIEGIWTRTYVNPVQQGFDRKFVETSSPGLRGQSGGPVFDVDGRIRGMQSHTLHLPLGFSPDLDISGTKVTEHQFLNVGVAVHSETIVAFLQGEGISIDVA